MTTLNDIRNELRCSNISEVKRAARRLGHDIVDPKKNLSTAVVSAIREEVIFDRRRGPKEPDVEEGGEDEEQTDRLMADAQPRLPGPVRAGGHRVFLHRDVEGWMLEAPPQLLARANLLTRQFMAHGRSSRVKGVQGAGKGWLRASLGGNGGKQFYLWWARRGAAPAADLDIREGEIFVRVVRHHDDTHLALSCGTRSDYTQVDPADVANDSELFGQPFTPEQVDVALSPARVRFIKGHPGSGKTTTLWHSTCVAEGDHVLYVTFSEMLGRQAEEYFASCGPKTQDVHVTTLEQLLSDLVPAGDQTRATFDPEIAARRFRDALNEGYRGALGAWQDREADLYAELHANWAGRALPIEFRKSSAAEGPALDRAAYLRLRGKPLGKSAAETAIRVGEFLLESDQARGLMPGPFRARAATDGLRAGDPIPTALQKIDWIVLDEVQDLTAIECLMVVELARGIGRLNGGQPPGLMAAGDEGQTVRPTDFDWGIFADLCSQLGTPTYFELPGNVRCPPNLAELVNRTWDLYGNLRRAARPRGYARAEIEDGDPGRVIIVEAETAGALAHLFEFVDRTPGAALVYPGYSIPPRYEGLVEDQESGLLWTSRAAKGLDFQIVGLLDAGFGMARAAELASDGRGASAISAVWSRNLVDQVRVGISRSTDTLLLVDIAPDERSKAAVAKLCAGVAEVQHADPEEAEALLSVDGLDVAEVISRFLDDIARLTLDHPQRALRRARVAHRVLDRSGAATASAAELRRGLAPAHALAAVVAALRTDQAGGEADASALLDEAGRMFGVAREDEARRAVGLAKRIVETAVNRRYLAAKSIRALAKLLRDLPQADRGLRRELSGLIQRWCRHVALTGPLPVSAAERATLSKELAGLAGDLGASFEELSTEVRDRLRDYRLRAGDLLRDKREFEEALSWYEGLGVPLREAACLEGQGHFVDAAKLYESGNDLEAALRCVRTIPDWEKSLELARQTAGGNEGRLKALSWSKRLLQVLDEASEDAERLTEAERRDLQGRFGRHRLLQVGVDAKESTREATPQRRGRKNRRG